MGNSNSPHAILVIDDELDVLKTFGIDFREIATILQAGSGAQALDILRSYKDKEIAVVVVDQRMPEMTGLELMLQLKRDFPHIVRVLFTGYSDIQVIQDVVNQADIFRYIRKPYVKAEVVPILKDALGKYEDDKEKNKYLNKTFKMIQEKTAHAMERYTRWIAHNFGNALQPVHTFVSMAAPEFGKKDESSKHFAEVTLFYMKRSDEMLKVLQKIYMIDPESFVTVSLKLSLIHI